VITWLCQMSWVVFSSYNYQNVRFKINFGDCFLPELVWINTCHRRVIYFRPKTPRTSYRQQRYCNNYKNGCKATVEKCHWGVPTPFKWSMINWWLIHIYKYLFRYIHTYRYFTQLSYLGRVFLLLLVIGEFDCILIGSYVPC